MMKRIFLTLSMTLLLMLTVVNLATGQEKPKPKKDTVNMDTDAKPTFYYPVEDDKKVAKAAPTILNTNFPFPKILKREPKSRKVAKT